MRDMPGGRAAAMTEATEQLLGINLRDPPKPEPVEEPPTAQQIEQALLGELAGQLLQHLGLRDRFRVRWAVRRGTSVDDPRLVAPAVALAQWRVVVGRELAPMRRRWWWLVLPPTVLVYMSTRLVLGLDPAWKAVPFVVFMLFASAGALRIAWASERRAARAERLNRALLPPVAFSPGENGSAPDDRPTTLEQPCPEKPDAS